MTTEMHDISDEKKVCDFEDDKVAEAEWLASEALRLAEESKRAAERLEEIRATIRYLTGDKPKTVEKPKPEALKTHIAPEEEPETEAASPTSVVSPTAALSPVSILKTAASKSGPKELRFTEDTKQLLEAASKEEVEAAIKAVEDNIIVRLYDAVGIDKLCGLDFDDHAALKPNAREAMSKMAQDVGIFASLSEESVTSVTLPDVRPEEISAVKRQILARKLGLATTDPFTADSLKPSSDPFEAESLNVADSADAIEEATDKPRSNSPELAVKPVVALKEEAPVAKTEAPVATVEAAKTEAPVATEEIVAEQPKELSIQTSGSALSQTGMTSIKQQILLRQKIHPLLEKNDPFGGEHDDMDFMGCGKNTVDEDHTVSSPFCGMGL